MTLADWIIVVVLAGAVLGGLTRGFFRSAFSLAGLILGLFVASWNYGRISKTVLPFIHNREIADAIAFLAIALLVMAAAAVLGEILAKIFQKVGLGCLDRLAGAVFGFFEGALLVTVCILVTMAFFPKAHWLTESRLPRYFFGACNVTTRVTPSVLAERIKQELRRLESESPAWMHPGKGE